MKRLLLLLLLALPSALAAQECRVLDPQLQGAYAGPCVNGLAEGFGHAQGIAEYRGGFNAGRKHGFGVYRWPSGDVYSGPWDSDRIAGPPTPMMLAQAKFREEARAAVGKQGQKVCRSLAVGIGARDWVRGTVIAVAPDKVAVRIDDPGRQAHRIGEVELRKGEVFWESPTEWIPCF